MSNPLIVAIDFDGTIVYNEEDLIPKSFLPNAKEVINWLHDRGCKIIIWTCRDKEHLTNAINFLKDNGVKFDSVNKQVTDFTSSEKVFANFYIDDRNFACEKINWIQIKKNIKNVLIQNLSDEILKIRKSKNEKCF